MAKITIEVETNPKTLKVMVDGQEIEGVSHVWIDQLIDRENVVVDLACSISTVDFNKDDKVVKSTTFSTAETKEVKLALSRKAEIRDDRFPGFVGYHTTVEDDINSFLS